MTKIRPPFSSSILSTELLRGLQANRSEMVSKVTKILIQCTFILCNFLLSASGLTMFVLSMLIRFYDHPRVYAAVILDERPQQLKADVVIFAVIGSVVFVVGILAMVGAIRESIWALRAFIVMIILIFLTQLGYVLAVIIMKDKIRHRVYRDIIIYLINYDIQSDELRRLFDGMQQNGECCGCTGRGDYRKLRYQVPSSCPESAQEGCCPYVWDNMKTLAMVAGLLLMAVGLVEYLAVIFAYILILSIHKKSYDVKKRSGRKNVECGKKSPVTLTSCSRVES